jgi:transposase-like protein
VAQIRGLPGRKTDVSEAEWLDARYEHVREDGRVLSMAEISAHGARADGVREVLGVDVGVREDVVPWRAFLQSLIAPGVRGVQLVTSDAHPGLKQVIAEVFVGASWQRCRGALCPQPRSAGPKSAQPLVVAAVRGIVQQTDRASAQAKLRDVCTSLAGRFPKVVALRTTAEEEVLTFASRIFGAGQTTEPVAPATASVQRLASTAEQIRPVIRSLPL